MPPPQAVAVLLALSLATGCTAERFPVGGVVAGQVVATTVDSGQAQALITGPPPSLDALPPPADRVGWQALAATTSLDTASLLLAATIAADPVNACWRERYEAELADLRAGRAPELATEDVLVLAVPGWMYRRNPETGADLARPRAVLARLGIMSELVATVENGSVEENAAIVAAAVRRHAAAGRTLILLSASKGGAEVAEALGHLLAPEEAGAVRAWVNVGGLLRGTPLADLATTWPTNWLAAIYFASKGIEPGESVMSLRTDRSTTRLERQRLPDGLRMVNLAGIPLSGQIGPHARFGYARLARYGPNDALTPIADILAHGGVTIAEIGLDHYFADPEIDMKTAALALTVLDDVLGEHDACPPPMGRDHGGVAPRRRPRDRRRGSARPPPAAPVRPAHDPAKPCPCPRSRRRRYRRA